MTLMRSSVCDTCSKRLFFWGVPRPSRINVFIAWTHLNSTRLLTFIFILQECYFSKGKLLWIFWWLFLLTIRTHNSPLAVSPIDGANLLTMRIGSSMWLTTSTPHVPPYVQQQMVMHIWSVPEVVVTTTYTSTIRSVDGAENAQTWGRGEK